MSINDPQTNPLFKRISELGFQPNTFAIFGSGPLFAHNITDKLSDVDLIVNDNGWQKSLTLGQLDHTTSGDPVIHIGDGIEICNTWAPGTWSPQDLIDEAEVINGLPFVRLESVLAWKKLRNKPKDQKHVELIEAYLKESQTRKTHHHLKN